MAGMGSNADLSVLAQKTGLPLRAAPKRSLGRTINDCDVAPEKAFFGRQRQEGWQRPTIRSVNRRLRSAFDYDSARKEGRDAAAWPFFHSCPTLSTGGLANLAPYQCAQRGAEDGSRGPAVLVIAAASATQRTTEQSAGTGTDDCAGRAAAAMLAVAVAAAVIAIVVAVRLLRVITLLLVVALLRVVALLLLVALIIAIAVTIAIVVALVAVRFGGYGDGDHRQRRQDQHGFS